MKLHLHVRFVVFLCSAAMLRASCPTPSNFSGESWQVYSVKYNFPTSTSYPRYYLTPLSVGLLGIQSNIDAAFNGWTYANRNQNLTAIGFTPGDPGYGEGLIRVYAYQVNYPGVPNQDPGKAAYTYVAIYSGTTQIAFASTELYFGSISSTGGYPCYDSSDSANYYAFVTKVMLHEIGHTMALGDQPVIIGAQCAGQISQESVMNFQCGTNDVGSNEPSAVTSCDNSTARR